MDSSCPICNSDAETGGHMFVQCEWVKRVWFGSVFQWHIDEVGILNMEQWVETKMDVLKKCL